MFKDLSEDRLRVNEVLELRRTLSKSAFPGLLRLKN